MYAFSCVYTAAMGPIRDLTSQMAASAAGGGGADGINNVQLSDVPPITPQHFEEALASVRPSVSEQDLGALYAWNESFGTFKRGATGAPPV